MAHQAAFGGAKMISNSRDRFCVVFRDVGQCVFGGGNQTNGIARRFDVLRSFAARNLRAVENHREVFRFAPVGARTATPGTSERKGCGAPPVFEKQLSGAFLDNSTRGLIGPEKTASEGPPSPNPILICLIHDEDGAGRFNLSSQFSLAEACTPGRRCCPCARKQST